MADLDGLSFARKYRPTTIARYIGNDKIKEQARKAINSGVLPQVIMLEGASGCGKTSFARLLAKEYLCYNRDEEKGACGECENCLAIDDYIVTGDTTLLSNIRELNVAQDSGKRDLDDVFEDMVIPSFGGEWKVYIFDECHKASNALQNRFLKIVEEPPEHILIIFCTTNPEEMIETLRNRCQLSLKVNKPKVKELAGLLRYVCECEQMDYDMKGLEFIANRGELTIRTSLQNLQTVVTTQNSAKYVDVVKVFEEISSTLIIDFFKALKSKDVLRFVTLLYDIKAKVDLNVFLTDIKGFVTRGIYTINGIREDGVSDGELKTYRDLFGDLGVEKISYLINRLMTLDTSNIEMELLTLGYSGLDVPVMQVANKMELPSIESLDNELAKEVKMTNIRLKEEEATKREQGISNVSSSMVGVNFDAIMAMGATKVES